MQYEPKFMSLDNKDSCSEKVEMPRKVVFYPYFHFKTAKNVERSSDVTVNAYKASFEVNDFDPSKLSALEKEIQKDRSDEYGFWTLKDSNGSYIGLGAKGLVRELESLNDAEVSYVLLKGNDILFVYSFGKSAGEYVNPKVDIYFSDANQSYQEKANSVRDLVTGLGLKKPEDEVKSELCGFLYKKYVYYEGNKTSEKNNTHIVLPSHEPGSFLSNVQGCAWHTSVVNDDIVNDGPHYVLLKNCDLSLGNIMDELSCWLVHRRGGFVMGKEFASNDFEQDTTFTIREVDEYVIDGITILNVECDTYSKNQDAGFEKFLKNISEKRFIRG